MIDATAVIAAVENMRRYPFNNRDAELAMVLVMIESLARAIERLEQS